MKTRFFLFLLLLIFFSEFLHAQRRSDYRDFGDTPNFYFGRYIDTDDNAFYQTECDISFYSDIADNCHAPLHVTIEAHDRGNDNWQNNLRLYPGGTMRESYDFMGLLDTQTRADRAEIDRRWDFRVILNRLSVCTWNTILKVSGYPIITEGLFAGINALEQVEIGPEIVTLEKDLFSGCKNLKYVKFTGPGSIISYIHQDVFWGCDALEVIEFDTDNHLWTENIKHMFTTKYGENTHPNMKAFVVADGCVTHLRNTLNDVFKPVKDGTCRVMSRSEFYAPRVNGVTLNASS
ncbi:MAG: leucine-rich repeat domain-containing protein, partial [Dysgonamonadaceae bacterium]|nr:leucine-rich repeat domain-containing protein [Dysgonamonadaceae bacterium]